MAKKTRKKTTRRKRDDGPPVEDGIELPSQPVGRPSRYKSEYCDALEKHLAKGYSVESFGSTCGVTREVVWRWAKKYPAFAEAKARGEAAREHFYIGMGQAIATGSLKMLQKEEYVQAPDGTIIRGPDGQPYINRIYRPANCNSAAWIFLTKNMLGWRDKRDIKLSGDADNPVQVMTREERLAEIERLQAQRRAMQKGD